MITRRAHVPFAYSAREREEPKMMGARPPLCTRKEGREEKTAREEMRFAPKEKPRSKKKKKKKKHRGANTHTHIMCQFEATPSRGCSWSEFVEKWRASERASERYGNLRDRRRRRRCGKMLEKWSS